MSCCLLCSIKHIEVSIYGIRMVWLITKAKRHENYTYSSAYLMLYVFPEQCMYMCRSVHIYLCFLEITNLSNRQQLIASRCILIAAITIGRASAKSNSDSVLNQKTLWDLQSPSVWHHRLFRLVSIIESNRFARYDFLFLLNSILILIWYCPFSLSLSLFLVQSRYNINVIHRAIFNRTKIPLDKSDFRVSFAEMRSIQQAGKQGKEKNRISWQYENAYSDKRAHELKRAKRREHNRN